MSATFIFIGKYKGKKRKSHYFCRKIAIMDGKRGDFNGLRKMIEDVTDKDLEKAKIYIDAAKTLYGMTSTPVYIIDFHLNKIVYVSKSLGVLCGMSPEEITKLGYEFYNNKFSVEKDLKNIEELKDAVLKTFALKPEAKGKPFCVKTQFRMRVGDKERLFNHTFLPYMWTEHNEVMLAINILSLAAVEFLDKAFFRQSDSDIIHKYTFSTHRWTEVSPIILTEDEKAILTLSAQGCDTREIAARIFRSIPSVKVYKRKMYKKLGVDNMTSALTFCTNYHLI